MPDQGGLIVDDLRVTGRVAAPAGEQQQDDEDQQDESAGAHERVGHDPQHWLIQRGGGDAVAGDAVGGEGPGHLGQGDTCSLCGDKVGATAVRWAGPLAPDALGSWSHDSKGRAWGQRVPGCGAQSPQVEVWGFLRAGGSSRPAAVFLGHRLGKPGKRGDLLVPPWA